MRKYDVDRCDDVLELIHTDICGPFPTPSWNEQQYYITFIDDYSRYDYLYLIHDKSQSLDVFKNFKAEVENQLRKKINVVRSYRGSEYYGRYDGSNEQRPGPFAKYLMECGIVPQYTMSGTPSQNGVAESLHFEQSPKQTEARPYKPNEKKLDSKTVSCYFVGYSERSRGFKFYDPSTRSFFETNNAKFIENVELSGREPLRKVVFEEKSISIPIIATGHGHIMFDDTIQNVQLIIEIVDTLEFLLLKLWNQFKFMKSSDSEKWIEAMKDEMKSMKDNGVWDLVKFPEGVKLIGCKWIFKTKRIQKIYRDRSKGILGLSPKSYIDKVLSKFSMSNCAPGDIPAAKGDKFSLHQCPRNELEKNDMERFPYALAIGSLMYAQVCTRPDIAYIVGMLGRYLSNSSMDNWKKAKRVLWYL
ncbi:Retrovirus-related Pol polyprotein from transposon TNT 1-94 [Vitis vinifera]|uniref:Retrovirus-related Pol polyprotein from transposon TNT 1-94 n=1 Tax=Vitis vinifera TaxID=29760 RepID=A0A438FEJ8_VITVI|nr:Retrovirus-related Pol polyprotein from transposon TNT 1-94 [Vitis vinifera]